MGGGPWEKYGAQGAAAAPVPATGGAKPWEKYNPAPAVAPATPKGKGTVDEPYDLSGLAPPDEHAARGRIQRGVYYSEGDNLRLNEHGGEGGNPIVAKRGKDGWYAQDPSDPKSFPRLQHDSGGAFVMSGGQRRGVGPQSDRGIGGYVGDEINTAVGVPLDKMRQDYHASHVKALDEAKHPEKRGSFSSALMQGLTHSIPDALSTGGQAAGLALSPMTGLVHGAVTRPLASAMTATLPHEQSENSLSDLANWAVHKTPFPATHKLSDEEQQASDEDKVNTGLSLMAPAEVGAPGIIRDAASSPAGKAAAKVGSALKQTGSVLKHSGGEFVSRGRDTLEQLGVSVPERGIPTAAQRADAETSGVRHVADLARKLKITPEKLRASKAEAAGKPITAAEEMGIPAETQLKVMMRRAGTTADQATPALRQRQEQSAERITQDFGEAAGIDPVHAEGDMNAMSKAMREHAKPQWAAVEAHGAVDDPRLEPILSTPAGQDAMKAALRAMGNRRVPPAEAQELSDLVDFLADGKPLIGKDGKPFQVPRGTDVTRQGFTLAESGGGPVAKPKLTLRTLDHIKGALDDMIAGYKNKQTGKMELGRSGTAEMSVLEDLRNVLTDPSTPHGKIYGSALEASGEPLQLEEAFRSAGKLMKNNRAGLFENAWAKYTPAQKAAHVAGTIADAQKAANSGGTKLKDLLTAEYKSKLTTMLGDEKAAALIDRLEMEKQLHLKGYGMLKGSDTYQNLEGANQMDSDIDHATTQATRSLSRGHVKRAATELLSSPFVGLVRGAQVARGEAIRDVAGALLAGKPSVLAQVLEKYGASEAEADKAAAAMKKRGAFTPGLAARAEAAEESGKDKPH